ncbi:MAG: hypothetical protein ACLGIC_12050 [Acidimicrobiia bacterium]
MTTVDHHRVAEERQSASGGAGSLGSILFLLFTAWGAFLGLLPLSDNSFMTHLATGRLILAEGAVPTEDPYSFTASGTSWTVQSWLPSVAYAAAERAGGISGLRLLMVATFVLATWLLWALTRSADAVVPRLLIVAVGMVVASGTWTERPYMVGVIGIAVTLLALSDRLPPWLLLPVGIVWVNSHGSFPLALVLCAAVVLGELLDQRSTARERVRAEGRATAFLMAGLLLGTVYPIGLRALTFPVGALTRSETFQLIREWQPPEFTSVPDRAFLLLFALAVVGAVHTGRWRHALPVLIFGLAAVAARRNLAMALPVLLAVVAHAAPAMGSLRTSTRPALGRVLMVPVGALVVLIVVVGLGRDAVDLRGFPARALAFVEATSGGPDRFAHQDVTGNLLEVLDGRSAQVFMDDRVDMYPAGFVADFVRLHGAEPGWDAVLEQYDIEAVIWARDEPIAEVLAAHPAWQAAYSDATWTVFVRR